MESVVYDTREASEDEKKYIYIKSIYTPRQV